jgi:DNA-binding response OmpR family regulator
MIERGSDQRSPDDPVRGPQRCLVIDDETDTASVLAYHLQRLGFVTTVAESGELGERYLRDELWDLVIVDVVLPDIDGRDLVPSIRALDSHPEVILTSVLSAGDLVDHCADALLSKPFRGVDVTAAVHTARKAA